MTPPRHKTRLLHATMFKTISDGLTSLGWVNAPVNFGAQSFTLIDYQPQERGEEIIKNTVAVSLGDVDYESEEELGCDGGGLASLAAPVFVDVFADRVALAVAVCDDVRDLLERKRFDLLDFIPATPVPIVGAYIDIDMVVGPRSPIAPMAIDSFKRRWRVMSAECRLFYQT